NDSQVPTYIARETVARLPNAQLVVSDEAGHLFVDIEPALFYDAMKAFITK
ncbi:MAG: alpha/beta hydrolase, partial [Bdellovibrionaceae bacterium]|nr:alpha/beta hydrolase [Pseudobdellovibrionaceae bacterium]